MISADAETCGLSLGSGGTDPIHLIATFQKESLFFFSFNWAMEFILTPWGNSQVFISVQYLLVSLPILADNLSQQGSWFSLAAQPRASADAPKAHPGRDPAQGWVKPIPIGRLQIHLRGVQTLLSPK